MPRASRFGPVVAVLVLGLLARGALAETTVLDRLGSDDRGVVDGAVTEIEAGPDGGPISDEDALFAAARATEDVLLDPARALRLYDRVLRIAPSSRIAIAAGRRAERLRSQVGPGDVHASRARDFATLIAHADTLTSGEIEQTARTLAAAPWPGAPDAALWLAEWQRRSGRFAAARASYDDVVLRWSGSAQARAAQRGLAGLAVDLHDWARAVALAERLPIVDTIDALERDDILAAAERGARFDRLYLAAWFALVTAIVLLVGSLAEAVFRHGRRRPRVPLELVFLAPIALVLVGVSFTAHRAIAPAVTIIASGGLVLAALSGATLDLLRARARPQRLRVVFHIALCCIAVIALVYIAVMRESLLEMLIETVRFGPDGG